MKRIALINDLSGMGKCSLTAAIPVISVMGMQACPLPTAVLSAQTGFGDVYCDDYTDRMGQFTEHWDRMGVTFDGIYSGYLASPQQIDAVAEFLNRFRHLDTFYLADPVMGDQGHYYSMVNEAYLQGMRRLAQRADVITPNLTELCFLTGASYEGVTACRHEEAYIDRIRVHAERILQQAERPQTIIVTGILREQDGMRYIGNLAVSADGSYYAETPCTGGTYSGTGDLFASVVCGALVRGMAVCEAVDLAMDFLQDAIRDAVEAQVPPNHGVEFERYLYRLMDPVRTKLDQHTTCTQNIAYMEERGFMNQAV